ncbi:MAG: hypothetical protein AB7P40_21610 [Chloroflexota bacterium]
MTPAVEAPAEPDANAVLAEALVRWQHAAGPYWPYVCAAPFLGLGESDQLVQAMRERLQRRLASRRPTGRDKVLTDLILAGAAASRGGRGVPDFSLPNGGLPVVLVDLPSEPVLAVAPVLSARGWYVVPVIQRWIASPAVLPCRMLLERLVIGAWQVRRPSRPCGVLLIADGERFGPAGYPLLARGRAFDNRYEYQICRFPSMAFLAAHGVAQVSWITLDRPVAPAAQPAGPAAINRPPVAGDLLPYRDDLVRAGIQVDVRLVRSPQERAAVWQPVR